MLSVFTYVLSEANNVKIALQLYLVYIIEDKSIMI